MADNVVTNPGVGGEVFATDEIAGVQYPRSKVGFGVDGAYVDASASNPLPAVDAAGNTLLAAIQTLIATLAGTIYAHNAPFVDGSPGQLMLGKRRDTDTTLVADGDLNTLNMDEVGRLKVSSQPASYPDVTGNITANAQTVFANVDRASNVTISMVATTLVGHNAIFEYSNNSTNGTDGNWYGVQVARSNANTAEPSTGVLAATPAYGWEASVNAYKWIRVRATAHTSGTAAYIIKQGTYATEPVPVIQVTGTQPVSGTVTVNGTVTANQAPPTPLNLNSAATTNLTSVKASAGTLYGLVARNTGASAAYLKLYNKASAPAVATDVPVLVIELPAGGLVPVNFGAVGHRFALGIALAITGAQADTDPTAIAAGQVRALLSYV